jgi:hypothetical protein
MSATTNDGGPAYPCESYVLKNGKQVTEAAQGMTLRDYFAAHALAGMLSDGRSNSNAIQWMPKEAYGLADAMLAARKEASK